MAEDKVTEGTENVGMDDAKEAKENGIVLPTLGSSVTDGLVTHGVVEALQKDKIDKVLVRESTSGVKVPSYLIDMTNVGAIVGSSLRGIKALLCEGGDTTVYIKNGDIVNEIGTGDSLLLYDMLDVYLHNVYSKRCKLYKNSGNGFEEIKPMDVSNVKLDI